MAGLTVTVYTRIRQMSEVDIVELAALMVEGKGVGEFLYDFMDIGVGHPFDDEVPTMRPEELCEALEAAAVKMMERKL